MFTQHVVKALHHSVLGTGRGGLRWKLCEFLSSAHLQTEKQCSPRTANIDVFPQNVSKFGGKNHGWKLWHWCETEPAVTAVRMIWSMSCGWKMIACKNCLAQEVSQKLEQNFYQSSRWIIQFTRIAIVQRDGLEAKPITSGWIMLWSLFHQLFRAGIETLKRNNGRDIESLFKITSAPQSFPQI